MGNTTVGPKNKAGICCSIVDVKVNEKDKKLENENNGRFSIAQGEELELSATSSKGYIINEMGEIIRPDGKGTGSVMSKKQTEIYNSYIGKISKQRQSKGNDIYI